MYGNKLPQWIEWRFGCSEKQFYADSLSCWDCANVIGFSLLYEPLHTFTILHNKQAYVDNMLWFGYSNNVSHDCLWQIYVYNRLINCISHLWICMYETGFPNYVGMWRIQNALWKERTNAKLLYWSYRKRIHNLT